MKKIIVVGGGAAGMMAAITAAENGCEVVIPDYGQNHQRFLHVLFLSVRHIVWLFL